LAERRSDHQFRGRDVGLTEHVIGVKLGGDRVAIALRLAMQKLIAAVAGQRLHVLHPEVVGERTDQMRRLFEAVLDLEA